MYYMREKVESVFHNSFFLFFLFFYSLEMFLLHVNRIIYLINIIIFNFDRFTHSIYKYNFRKCICTYTYPVNKIVETGNIHIDIIKFSFY